ncbi:DUF4270 family protein [Flavobacterium sp.]|uniref:DUF4270 family protein n=1 Tax=Flavobacterium sp. TaxID=239 RepID=UPI0011FA9DEA|nr:DUF4270 family protein [Flavobacterium sp.]RZJ72277.1 MAG: DUF4270 family protein [Flavobacterium sp.]
MIHSIRLFALCLIGIFATSCSDTDIWLDSDQLTGTNLRLIRIDTFQVDMSTFKFDSIVNDSGTRILVGQYEDPVFGKVRADAFAELIPATYYIPEETVFDSIVLNLPYDDYFYADTLAHQRIQVRQLTETIKLPNGVTDYYNTANFNASDALLGETYFLPRTSKDSVTVKLSDALGQLLYTNIRSGQIASAETLRDYFKGVKLSPSDADNAAIMGYNVQQMYIRLYYSYPGSEDSEGHLDFKLNGIDEVRKYATRITSDRSGTAFSGLANQEMELASGSVGNLTYLQSGIGLTAKIKFPTIRSISQINEDNGKIFKANLKLRIDPNYYNDNLYAVDSMYVLIVDQNNDIFQVLADEAGNEAKAYIKRENTEYNEVYVIAPVTTFLQKMLENPEYLNYGIALMPVGYNAAVSRLVITAPTFQNNQSKLELIYAIYD